MKEIHFYGKRGMGDIVATLSYFFKTGARSDCHLIFHYPPGHGYDKLIPDVFNSFARTKYNITHEFRDDWFSINEEACITKFGKRGLFESSVSDEPFVWWFTGSFFGHRYWPYRVQWKGNTSGHIALVLNHEFFNVNHPIKDKFFSERHNNELKALVNNKNVFALGMHNTYEQNLTLIRQARYVVGVEGGWTHVSNAMNAPFIIVRNKRSVIANTKVHRDHPNLTVIDYSQIGQYISLPKNQHAEQSGLGNKATADCYNR